MDFKLLKVKNLLILSGVVTAFMFLSNTYAASNEDSNSVALVSSENKSKNPNKNRENSSFFMSSSSYISSYDGNKISKSVKEQYKANSNGKKFEASNNFKEESEFDEKGNIITSHANKNSKLNKNGYNESAIVTKKYNNKEGGIIEDKWNMDGKKQSKTSKYGLDRNEIDNYFAHVDHANTLRDKSNEDFANFIIENNIQSKQQCYDKICDGNKKCFGEDCYDKPCYGNECKDKKECFGKDCYDKPCYGEECKNKKECYGEKCDKKECYGGNCEGNLEAAKVGKDYNDKSGKLLGDSSKNIKDTNLDEDTFKEDIFDIDDPEKKDNKNSNSDLKLDDNNLKDFDEDLKEKDDKKINIDNDLKLKDKKNNIKKSVNSKLNIDDDFNLDESNKKDLSKSHMTPEHDLLLDDID